VGSEHAGRQSGIESLSARCRRAPRHARFHAWSTLSASDPQISAEASDLAELKPAPAGLAPALLAELIRRVVEAAKPDRIIRFGSAAGSERGPDSDLDLLVIKSGVEHLRRLAEAIYLNLSGIGSR
jgi:hypothetical protein